MIATVHSDQNASPPRVEVITSIQRRRRWPTAELFSWRRRMLEGGLQAVLADEDVVGTSRVRELERRVRELERLLGRKTMEVEILLAATIMERSQGRFAMKAVADTLAVARSNLIERGSRRAKSRRPYRKAYHDELFADPPAGGRAPNLRVSAYPAPHTAHNGRCMRPSRHPMPSAINALAYGWVSMVLRSQRSGVVAVSRAVSVAWP